ncbi:MAG TPA: cyclase family protein [bacterium]
MRIVDLSHEVYNGMQQIFAGPIPSIFDNNVRIFENFQAVSDACVLQNHLGTHIDAPRHYNPKGGRAVHEVPLEQLITETVVLDLTAKPGRSAITADDLDRALRKTGETIHEGDGVIIHVGGGAKYRTWQGQNWRDSEYANTPYLSEDAVQWLLARKISILGIDALAPDWEEGYRPAHQILLRDNNIPIIENLCNLDQLSRPRITFIALPPKVVGASGFLVRAVAIEK